MDKPLVWLHGEIKTPPFSPVARREAGFQLRRLQEGEKLGMPQSRPMPLVGPHCHELRVVDAQIQWRIIYRLDWDAIVVVSLFSKKTPRTPLNEMRIARERLRRYDDAKE